MNQYLAIYIFCLLLPLCPLQEEPDLNKKQLQSLHMLVETNQTSPYLRDAYNQLIHFYIEEKNWYEFNRVAEKFQRIYPHDPLMEKVLYHHAVITAQSNYLGDLLESKRAFEEVKKTYPQGKYVELSQLHLKKVHDKLAAHELKMIRVHYKQKNWAAAINRVQYIQQNYPESPIAKSSEHLLLHLLRKIDASI